MSASSLAGQQQDRGTAHLPGDGSMWFFVLGDFWIFTCYFACYVYDRAQQRESYLAGQQLLSQATGVFNTLVLLTSSLFIALSVQASRVGDKANAARFVVLGGGCGVLFASVKAWEWSSKVAGGLPQGTEDFFLYYFMFTGLHMLHVSLGLLILVLVWRELRTTTPRAGFVETGATYWHMVDALWIAIFALLYLVR